MGLIVSISWQVKVYESFAETHSSYVLLSLGLSCQDYWITWNTIPAVKSGKVTEYLNRWLMHKGLDFKLLRGRDPFL